MDSTLISQLLDVARRKIEHVNNGMCPDDLEGFDVRDDECPACRVLIEAEQATQNPWFQQLVK